LGRWASDPSWWSAAIQSVGTLLFNVDTFDAMLDGLSTGHFGILAIASYVVPSSGSILDLAASNWCTVLGALCFFIGALLVLPRRHAKDARAAGRPIVTKEA
jgi:hypothetical protein